MDATRSQERSGALGGKWLTGFRRLIRLRHDREVEAFRDVVALASRDAYLNDALHRRIVFLESRKMQVWRDTGPEAASARTVFPEINPRPGFA